MESGNNSKRDILREVGFHLTPRHIIEKSVPELLDLKGKKAVVTGAGGAGLGQACVNRLAGCGADIALVDINIDGARRVAGEVTRRWGTKTITVEGNIFDWDSAQQFMRQSYEKLGRIDILVNNAASAAVHPFEKQSKQEIDFTVTASLTGTLYCSRAVLDYMIPQKSGRIINVSSVGAQTFHRNLVVYDACKAAVVHFTRCLASEVAHYGIYVLGVCPGVMLHTGLQQILQNPTEEYRDARESILEGFRQTDLGRVSLPEEVANMVAFLSSEAASFMCGVSVDMGGGQIKHG